MKPWIIGASILALVSGTLLAQTPQIRIDVRGTSNVLGIDVGRWYGVLPITCPSPEHSTIAVALGPDVRTLTVGRYDTTRFKTEA
jgi:hypothetical protein